LTGRPRLRYPVAMRLPHISGLLGVFSAVERFDPNAFFTLYRKFLKGLAVLQVCIDLFLPGFSGDIGKFGK